MKTQPTYFGNGKLPSRYVKTTKPMLLIFCLALVMGSCNINPDLQEVSQLENAPVLIESNAFPSAILPGTALSIVSLDKIDLYVYKSTAAQGGDILVSIHDSDTNEIMGSTSLPVDDLHLSAPATFSFVPAINLIRGNKYQIHVNRVGGDTGNSSVVWRCSRHGADSYPDGSNSVCESAGMGEILDFAFKTYTQGVIDQQQPMTGYGFYIDTRTRRWQEFKPELVVPIKY
jgi:hypothetical protein